jgi:hypothetical protein
MKYYKVITLQYYYVLDKVTCTIFKLIYNSSYLYKNTSDGSLYSLLECK